MITGNREASQRCEKLSGMKIGELAVLINRDTDTLRNWHRDNLILFDAVCVGVRINTIKNDVSSYT